MGLQLPLTALSLGSINEINFISAAAGVDGIRPGFILDASDILFHAHVQTSRKVLENGVLTAWCTGLFHPSLQAGDDPSYPSNYRGITVVVILTKL